MIWKDIEGYEGIYQVSDTGMVRSLDRTERSKGNSTRRRKGRNLKFKINKYGYYVVGLNKDNKRHEARVHRLVAEAFIDNPENKPCVNHKDGNKLNNSVDNLEWNTVSENTWHATHVIGTNKPALEKATEASKKKTLIKNTLTDEIYEFDSRKDAELFFGKEFREIVGSRQRKQFKHLKLVK